MAELLHALNALVAQGYATLPVLAAHGGLIDDVPVPEVALIHVASSDAQWVLLR